MNSPGPRELVRAVRAELATPGRYHLAPPPGVRRSWLQLAFGWLADRYSEFIRSLSAHVHVNPHGLSIAGDALVAVSVLLVGAVAARLLVALQVERAQRGRVRAIVPVRSALALSQAAADAASAADYARAVRLLFAAAVTLLDLRGVVHDDASATINQLRRELRTRNPQADEPFADVAGAFVEAVYADRAPDAEAWERARTGYERLSKSVSSA